MKAAESADRRLRDEALFREVNERIAELTGFYDTGVCLFVCECADHECAESLELTAAEYRAVRAHPARFLVHPGHRQEQIGDVVERHDRYLVVEPRGASAPGDPSGARPA